MNERVFGRKAPSEGAAKGIRKLKQQIHHSIGLSTTEADTLWEKMQEILTLEIPDFGQIQPDHYQILSNWFRIRLSAYALRADQKTQVFAEFMKNQDPEQLRLLRNPIGIITQTIAT